VIGFSEQKRYLCRLTIIRKYRRKPKSALYSKR